MHIYSNNSISWSNANLKAKSTCGPCINSVICKSAYLLDMKGVYNNGVNLIDLLAVLVSFCLGKKLTRTCLFIISFKQVFVIAIIRAAAIQSQHLCILLKWPMVYTLSQHMRIFYGLKFKNPIDVETRTAIWPSRSCFIDYPNLIQLRWHYVEVHYCI